MLTIDDVRVAARQLEGVANRTAGARSERHRADWYRETMSIWGQIKGFVRAFRRGEELPTSRHGGHSLARTLKESTHVRGGNQVTGLSRAGTEKQHEIVAEGHERYTASFDDD